MTDSIGQLIFFLLTPISHIGASLFFAKPRFSKVVTAAIWLLYVALLVLLPANTPTANFFLALAAHFVLFFVTTVGSVQEKGFLFFSYAGIYSCFGTIYNVINFRLQNEWLRSLISVGMMVLMQVLLYAVLLPAFRKVAPYVRSGWGNFYAVVLSFFALILAQTAFPVRAPFSEKESAVFLLTALAFGITYVSVFANMKNIVELTREKQKQTQTKLLYEQVRAQAKEAQLVRQNRHDLRHHYHMLLSYAENGEFDKLTSYLKYQTDSIEHIAAERYCENETVNNTLRVYHQKISELGIGIDICAAAKPNLNATDADIVCILANILENAYHGAIFSESKAPFVRVNIKHQAGRFVIVCDNSCAKPLNFEEMPDHLRGIGIKSITATADKYSGSCRFSAKDGVFHCMVVMDE